MFPMPTNTEPFRTKYRVMTNFWLLALANLDARSALTIRKDTWSDFVENCGPAAWNANSRSDVRLSSSVENKA